MALKLIPQQWLASYNVLTVQYRTSHILDFVETNDSIGCFSAVLFDFVSQYLQYFNKHYFSNGQYEYNLNCQWTVLAGDFKIIKLRYYIFTHYYFKNANYSALLLF
jgi:hypothetical protein